MMAAAQQLLLRAVAPLGSNGADGVRYVGHFGVSAVGAAELERLSIRLRFGPRLIYLLLDLSIQALSCTTGSTAGTSPASAATLARHRLARSQGSGQPPSSSCRQAPPA